MQVFRAVCVVCMVGTWGRRSVMLSKICMFQVICYWLFVRSAQEKATKAGCMAKSARDSTLEVERQALKEREQHTKALTEMTV
jgi:hypothetical protein